jgi:hypothetical protein
LKCSTLIAKSSKSSSFTLRLEESQNITLTNWSLDVTDDGSPGWIIEEFDSHLDASTLGTGSAENLGDLCLLDFSIHLEGCLLVEKSWGERERGGGGGGGEVSHKWFGWEEVLRSAEAGRWNVDTL